MLITNHFIVIPPQWKNSSLYYTVGKIHLDHSTATIYEDRYFTVLFGFKIRPNSSKAIER